MTYRKLLVAVDFSPIARDAMRVAADLAVQAKAELLVAHVWQTPIYSFASEAPFPGDVVEDLVASAEKLLAEWTAEARNLGANARSVFLDGVAWDRIVDTLRRDPAIDLCVIGTHGRTGIRHALLGSVAEKVVRHAPCAVLVYRHRA